MKWFKKDRKQALPWSDTYKLRSELEIEILKRFIEIFYEKRKQEDVLLAEQIREIEEKNIKNIEALNDELEYLSDEQWMLELIQENIEQLAIVGLYRIVEHGTKNMFRWIFNGDERRIRSTFQWDKQHDILASEFKFDLKSIIGYSEINELRLLNNVIKHNDGIVDDNLCEFSNWNKGEKIQELFPVFEKLSKKVPIYLENLARKLNQTLIQRTENEDIFKKSKI